MSIDASFNTHGLLEVNITIEHSPGKCVYDTMSIPVVHHNLTLC